MGEDTKFMRSYDRILDYKYFNEISTSIIENDTTEAFIVKPPEIYMRSFHDYFFSHIISEFPDDWPREKYFILIYVDGELELCFSNENFQNMIYRVLSLDSTRMNEEYPVILKTIKEMYGHEE